MRRWMKDWNKLNPILADGEVGEIIGMLDTKTGDGKTPWKDLRYTGTIPEPGSLMTVQTFSREPRLTFKNFDTVDIGTVGGITDAVPWSAAGGAVDFQDPTIGSDIVELEDARVLHFLQGGIFALGFEFDLVTPVPVDTYQIASELAIDEDGGVYIRSFILNVTEATAPDVWGLDNSPLHREIISFAKDQRVYLPLHATRAGLQRNYVMLDLWPLLLVP